jgi:hypothetical protein
LDLSRQLLIEIVHSCVELSFDIIHLPLDGVVQVRDCGELISEVVQQIGIWETFLDVLFKDLVLSLDGHLDCSNEALEFILIILVVGVCNKIEYSIGLILIYSDMSPFPEGI